MVPPGKDTVTADSREETFDLVAPAAWIQQGDDAVGKSQMDGSEQD